MQVDYLIIGQGISGTMLSWFLVKEGKTFLVLDDALENSPSRVAAGIINPVTGRRYAYTWMIDHVMPFAVDVYKKMGLQLQTNFVFQKSIIDFFPSPQMRTAFIERLADNDTYLHPYPDQNYFNPIFEYHFGTGEISPAFAIDIAALLIQWREKLLQLNAYRNEKFILAELKVEDDYVQYGDVYASKIIFCEGSSGFDNPWFRLLPFAPNKGEALIIETAGLPEEHIYKKGLMLVPMSNPGNFWLGSNYQWEFTDDQPSNAFYAHATTVLKGWLKNDYQVLSHKAAVRPATLERRPFVGLHPQQEQIGILNGMGTKGTSLAPFFAYQLVQHLVHGLPINADADVRRFMRILSK